MNGILKSKTIWFSLLLIVAGALQEAVPQLKEVITPDAYGYTMTGIGFIVAVLRAVTTTSING